MVTLYGLDTLNMLRTSSETLNLAPSPASHTNNSKKWQRQQLLELFKKNENAEDLSLSSEIQAWFKSLPTSARYSVVSHEAPLICTFLWQMFIKKLSEVEVNFTFEVKSAKTFDSEKFENIFSVQKKSPRSQLISSVEFQTEKAFEKSIRLTDSNEYLDTLTVENELLVDVDKFLEYMHSLSAGKAFRTPCTVTWDANTKLWLWEYPGWFNCHHCLSLASWACASIEKAIWVKYWAAKSADPVSAKSSLKNFENKAAPTNSCQLLENLTVFFKELKGRDKEKIVGNKEKISEDFEFSKGQLIKNSSKSISYISMPKSAMFPTSQFCFTLYSYPYTSIYSYTEKSNLKFHQSSESVSTVTKKLSAGNDLKFIEFLMNTPLDRAVTLLDIVIRKVLYRIINAFTEKNALELIENEPVAVKSAKSKPKKKKNRSKKAKKPKQVESLPEDRLKIETFVQSILAKVIEDSFKKIEDQERAKQELKTDGFQEVCSQKSKHRKQPQQTSRPASKKYTKHARRQTKAEEKLEEAVPEVSVFDKMHKEIIDFAKSRAWKLESKVNQINKVLEKLTEIVCVAFTSASIVLFGSYASGLAIEESDVDLVVTGLELADRLQVEMACEYLAKTIEESKIASKIQCINTARIPVIKLEVNSKTVTCADGLISIDISFDDSCEGYGTHLGLNTLYLTIELQKIYPHLQNLVLVIKKFLYIQGLNSAYKGGLGSYSVVLWVAAFLNSMSTVPDNLGKLLCEIFRHYGYMFDPKKMGVNIINGGSFFELESPGMEAVITIDPVNMVNNTRMVYRIEEILAAFRWAYDELMEKESKNKRFLSRIFSKRKVD